MSCLYRYEARVIPNGYVNPPNKAWKRQKKKGKTTMSIFDKFDQQFDTEALKEDAKKAAENGGGDYPEGPWGDYMVKVDRAELKEAKSSGKPMLSIWFKITEGEFKNSIIFYNQVVASGFGLHMACEFLRSLETDIFVDFNGFAQFADVILDVSEAAQNFEYHLKYSERKAKNGNSYNNYEIVEVFEVE